MTEQNEGCVDTYTKCVTEQNVNDRTKSGVLGHMTAQPQNLISTSVYLHPDVGCGVGAYFTTAHTRGSKDSSVYCTASLPCKRLFVAVLTTVQE